MALNDFIALVYDCLNLETRNQKSNSLGVSAWKGRDKAPMFHRKKRKKEIPYEEGILKDIGAHVGYTVIYWRCGYLSGGTNLNTPRGRYTRAVTNSTARGL